MDKSSIETKIKDRLQHHRIDVDNDMLYKDLGIDKKSKRRLFFWIFFGIMATAFFAILIWWQSHQEVPKVELATAPDFEVLRSLPEVNTDVKQGSQFNAGEKVRQSKIGDTSNMQARFNVTENSNSNLTHENLMTSRNEIPNLIDLIEENRTAIAIGQIDSELSQSSTDISSAKISNETNNLPGSVLGDLLAEATELSEITDNSKSKTANRDNSMIENLSVIDVVIDDLPHTILFEVLEDESEFVASFPIDSSKLIFGSVDKNIKLTGTFLLSPYVGYSRFEENLAAIDRNAEELQSFRSVSEQSLEVISAGFLLNYRLPSGFTFSSGLDFSRYNSVINYTEVIYKESKDSVVSDIRLNFVGDSTFVMDALGEQQINRKWTRFNRLDVWSVPLLVGYGRNLNGINFELATGVSLGLISGFKGTLANEQIEMVTNPDIYQTSVKLLYHLQAGTSFAISSKHRIWATLHYKQSINSWTKKSYILRDSRNLVGCQIGLQYRL